MPFLRSSDRRLGLAVILCALAALLFWLPFDIDTGLVETVRRRITIGDSLMPTVALGFVVLGGLMTAVAPQPGAPRLTIAHAAFLARLAAWLILAFALMRWSGPLTVEMLGVETDYRALRDTAPWKYIGFVLGGTALVSGLTSLAEGRFSLRGLVLGLAASFVLIALYDLPFDDLLLPPNGDV
jgi:hypothetical protein